MADEQRRKVEKAIAVAIRQTIASHGPITTDHIGSAAKRVYGTLLSGGYLASPEQHLGPDGRATG